ncbi:MAG TPA: helix-turn-helix domain-containing protein [Patescibacteria group bacterium]|nr:helix-turn-helix domain-containing protein [Patescibacteria group bacterium]
MKSVGDILRRAREKQKKSLSNLAETTHIRPDYIEAIERNDFYILPSHASLFGFVDTLARELGIDAKMLVSIARRDAGTVDVQPIRSIPLPFIRRIHMTPALACLIASLVVFAGYAGWSIVSLRSAPALTITMPKDGTAVSSPVIVRGNTLPDASLEIDTQSVATSTDGSFVYEIDLPTGPHSITAIAKNRYGAETIKQISVQVEK